MTDPAAANSRPPSRTGDRTLRGATITIAVASLGLTGAFTYQAAQASINPAVAAGTTAPSAQPRVNHENDDESPPSGVAPPVSAPSGQPVAVSGGS